MAPTIRTEKGETIYVSPHTGERFTSQFAYNDHVARWPQVCEENGLNLDGSPKGSEPLALEDMTIAQLRALAAEEGVELGEAKKKAEIITVIETARAAATDDTNPNEGDGEGDDDGTGQGDEQPPAANGGDTDPNEVDQNPVE